MHATTENNINPLLPFRNLNRIDFLEAGISGSSVLANVNPINRDRVN